MANETSSMHCSTAAAGEHSFTVSINSARIGPLDRYLRSADTFATGRYEWEVSYYPDGAPGSGGKDIGVQLKLLNPHEREVLHASFTITLHDPAMSVEVARREFSHTFTGTVASSGTWQYMSKDQLIATGFQQLVVKCVLDGVASRLFAGDVIVPPSNLGQDIGGLFEKGTAWDTTVRIAQDTFKVNKCVLAARSPVLMAQLHGPMNKRNKRIFRPKGFDARVFKILVHFMYSGSLPKSMDDHGEDIATRTKDLLVAADLYGMERLKLICESKLSKALEVDTVVDRLELAEKYYCEHLKDCCIKYMLHRDRLLVVMEREDFKQLTRSNPNVMKEMLRAVAGIL